MGCWQRNARGGEFVFLRSNVNSATFSLVRGRLENKEGRHGTGEHRSWSSSWGVLLQALVQGFSRTIHERAP